MFVTLVTAAKLHFSITKCSVITNVAPSDAFVYYILLSTLLLEKHATSEKERKGEGDKRRGKRIPSEEQIYQELYLDLVYTKHEAHSPAQLRSWEQKLKDFKHTSGVESEQPSGARVSVKLCLCLSNDFLKKKKVVIIKICASLCVGPQGLGWHCGMGIQTLLLPLSPSASCEITWSCKKSWLDPFPPQPTSVYLVVQIKLGKLTSSI